MDLFFKSQRIKWLGNELERNIREFENYVTNLENIRKAAEELRLVHKNVLTTLSGMPDGRVMDEKFALQQKCLKDLWVALDEIKLEPVA